MTHNVGGADRGARLIVGSILVAISLMVALPGYWELVPFVIGAVLLVTGIFRYCPINRLLGLDTRRTDPRRTST